MLGVKAYFDKIICNSENYESYDGTVYTHSLADSEGAYNQADCEATKNAALVTAEMWAAIAFIVAVLSFIEMISCGIGSMSANMGYKALMNHEVFVGLPPPMPVGGIADGNIITVVGQPVTSGVVMGSPVSGAPVIGRPAEGDAKDAFGQANPSNAQCGS